VDYHFLTQEEFQRRREAGEFLESFEVYGSGYWYGTLRGSVAPSLSAGKWVVLEIDVQGTLEVVKQYPEAVTVFVAPRSPADLEQRLRARNTESPEALTRRLDVGLREMSFADRYRHHVVNDNVDRAVDDLCNILMQYY
jgi:guanylate kinase